VKTRKTIILEGGGPVGEFATWRWPRRDGTYRYTLYRSGSRVQMHKVIRETGSARCYYIRDGQKVSFSVEGETQWCRLQISHLDLSTSP
jgi:hypothetical protein